MKVWNTSNKRIMQMYNRAPITIEANSTVVLEDDKAAFLLSKREIRGQGLIQIQDNDDLDEKYRQGQLQIYNWAKEKYGDYERHCEEREAQRLQPLKPHAVILEYKKIIDEYEKWEEKGSIVKDEIKQNVGEGKIYACIECGKEFNTKAKYFEHVKLHRPKEEVNVNVGSISNESKGKS